MATNPKPVHRHLQFHAAALQHGMDVRALQNAINARGRSRGLTRLVVDGQAGRQTIAVGRQCARALGIRTDQDHGLTRRMQRVIRHPGLRGPRQLVRAHKWARKHPKGAGPAPGEGVRVSGNTVTGGTKRQRIVAAAMRAAHLYSTGQSHRFYSQAGKWIVSKGITGESRGYRSDCSQFITSLYHSAGVDDPNRERYTGGYTGTLGASGRYIGRSQLKPGDLILYGPAPHHHVELYVGPGNRTVGHGSAPVDAGDIYMISDPHFVTYGFLD